MSSETAGGPRLRRHRGGTLVDEITAALRRDLDTGQLAPGARLPSEAHLVERFNVSRSVVREALSQLQAAGQVRTRHGIGTFVLERQPAGHFSIAADELATLQDVIAVLDLRIGLECEAAALAAQRRDPQALNAIGEALEAFEVAIAEGGDAVAADFGFHMAIAAATGNRHFAELMAHLGTRSIPRARISTADRSPEGRDRYLRRVQLEHRRIHAAICDGDPTRARKAMRVHLGNSRDRLRR